MNSRKTCYSINDLKAICPSCGEKNFAHRDTNADYTICCYCGESIGPLDHTKEWAFGDPNAPAPIKPIFDLIYTKDVADLVKHLPGAKTNEVWDQIHEWRCEIEAEVSREEYFYWVILEGYAEISLTLQMAIRMVTLKDVEHPLHKAIKAALARLEKEKKGKTEEVSVTT